MNALMFEVIDYREGVHVRTPGGDAGHLYRFFLSAADAFAYMGQNPRARLAYHRREWHESFLRHAINNGHARFMRRGEDGYFSQETHP